MRNAPGRRDVPAYGRLWRTSCCRLSFMNAANDDTIIAAIFAVIGLKMAGLGRLVGGW
jgi:hypothetical protein